MTIALTKAHSVAPALWASCPLSALCFLLYTQILQDDTRSTLTYAFKPPKCPDPVLFLSSQQTNTIFKHSIIPVSNTHGAPVSFNKENGKGDYS